MSIYNFSVIVMNNLKKLRKEKDCSQKDIAKLLKISQNGYSQYENEIRSIPIFLLKNLAIYFNTSLDYLLGLTNIQTKYLPSKIIPTSYPDNRLKEIREDRDLNQKKVADLLEMSRSGYSAYETGSNVIPNSKLIKLALFYNVSIDYILYLTDERKVHKRI